MISLLSNLFHINLMKVNLCIIFDDTRYLDPRIVEQFGAFIKEKIRLIVETRQQSELLKGEEELIKCLKEYTANNVMII